MPVEQMNGQQNVKSRDEVIDWESDRSLRRVPDLPETSLQLHKDLAL